LALMVALGASDLFLSADGAASLKMQGRIRRLPEPPLMGTHIKRLTYSVMRDS
jgi:Tfp pilus assembly ATPase PilU